MENKDVVNAQPELFGIPVDDTKSYVYEKVWNLCAGLLCDLPKVGEKVYYFPQGHFELLEASTKEELDQTRPIFDLPCKLLCLVTAVHRRIDQKTDEVYADISLMSDTIQVITPTTPKADQERPIIHSFVKVLTASDTSPYGGLSVLRKHIIDCLPPLDMSEQIPSQEIVTKDLHGDTWKFKHIFRGTPQRHIFTSGWSAFATAKRLVAGDSLVLVSGDNGEIRVGIRRRRHQQDNVSSSILSAKSMQHGLIASAVNALKNKCSFIVVYKPRSSQFVVSYDKFVDAMNNNFNIGSRFMMRFEGEDFCERRYSGTVIGVNDLSPHWKDSEWRSLQVQWDEFASLARPDRISPWEIEHLMPSANVLQSALFKKKRSRQVNEIGSTSLNLWTPTLSQGQDNGKPSMSTPTSVHQLSNREAIKDSKFPSAWPMSCSVPITPEPNNNNNNQMVRTRKGKMTTDANTSCRLFGVDVGIPLETKDHMGRPMESLQKSEVNHTNTLTSPKEVQSKQFLSTRSRTKVQMQGVAIGRAVDLTILSGYNQLIQELEKLFDLNGELQTRNRWELVFTDNEGDMCLLGDDPWPEFCNMVKKILIRSKEEVNKLTSEIRVSQSS